MTKRSVSVLAVSGLGLGLLGSFATGCNLGSGGTVGVQPETTKTDPATDLRVPSSQEELSGDGFLEQLDSKDRNPD
jgi:hypothetical protein